MDSNLNLTTFRSAYGLARRVFTGIVLLVALAGQAQAAITVGNATQNAITTFTPGVDITYVNRGNLRSRNNCGNITPSIPGGNVGDLLIASVVARHRNAAVTGHSHPGGRLDGPC